jgi:hypothetical protein
MVDYEQAVKLAMEGKLTMGEIAHRIGWPEQRSLSSLVKYLEAKLPKPLNCHLETKTR